MRSRCPRQVPMPGLRSSRAGCHERGHGQLITELAAARVRLCPQVRTTRGLLTRDRTKTLLGRPQPGGADSTDRSQQLICFRGVTGN
jgi:hypothetical protein